MLFGLLDVLLVSLRGSVFSTASHDHADASKSLAGNGACLAIRLVYVNNWETMCAS